MACISISSKSLADATRVAPTCVGARSCTFVRGEKGLLLNLRNMSMSTSMRRRRKGRGGSVRVRSLFGLGVPELVVIAGVTALIFGPKKLPEIGRSLGKTVKSFQEAAKEFETEVKKEGEPSTTELPESTASKLSAEADEKNVQI